MSLQKTKAEMLPTRQAEWFCNIDTPDHAETVAANLNAMAREILVERQQVKPSWMRDVVQLGPMNVALYQYTTGEPLIVNPECLGMGAIYRTRISDESTVEVVALDRLYS